MVDLGEYKWLSTIDPLPKMISEAIKIFGTKEQPGKANNPVIIGWAKEVGGDVATAYLADEIPWCGLFMAIVAKRAGKKLPPDPLWALNWKLFGEAAGQPGLGDVLSFARAGGGHVALYVGEDSRNYHILGGNQGDKVCFATRPKETLKAARRPIYLNQPTSVKPYIVTNAGSASIKED